MQKHEDTASFFMIQPDHFSIKYSFVSMERKWVFFTNSNLFSSISLYPEVVDHLYFKLWILLDYISKT